MHKQLNGKNIWFLANPYSEGKNIEIELSGKYKLETWDPHTSEISGKIQTKFEKGITKVKLHIDNNQSIFLVEK